MQEDVLIGNNSNRKIIWDVHEFQKLKELQLIKRDTNKVYGIPSIRSALP